MLKEIKQILEKHRADIASQIEKYKADNRFQIKECKDDTRSQVEKIKRYFDVVKEDTDSKIDLIIEGQDSFNKRLTSVETKIDSHTEMIGNLAVSMEIAKNDIKEIKAF